MLIIVFQFEMGVIPIPKSVTKTRIIGNINIFDFKLSDEDTAVLAAFNSGSRLVALSQGTTAVEYPYSIPY